MTKPDAVWVWGLPLAPYTMEETLEAIDGIIAERVPSYIITANLNYAMLSSKDAELRQLNEEAAFLVADGMPLVWQSRRGAHPLPERVAGSDLIYQLSERAAQKGYRLYLLGAAPGIAQRASEVLQERYPGLQIVGVESPPYRAITPEEHEAQIQRIRDARPDILFVAFGQPFGEKYIWKNCEAFGVPLGVQVGASLDFVAGKVKRSPRWMQRTGLEWLYRLQQEPLRLFRRYWNNGWFLIRSVLFPGKAKR
jgi:N-acetylglucosaminyldiphosphoundecaprenol N-acetyl-beta-D-mannosaminyltransferase